MADLHVKCPDCGRVWLVAQLPMEATKAVTLIYAARCPCGSHEPPWLPNAEDMRLVELRAKLASLHAMQRLAEDQAKRVLEEILDLRRRITGREIEPKFK